MGCQMTHICYARVLGVYDSYFRQESALDMTTVSAASQCSSSSSNKLLLLFKGK